MYLRSESFANGQPIPSRFAFARIGQPVELAENLNPHLAWGEAPAGTRSFVITCIDPDAPSRRDDANQPGKTLPADLPRTEFVHWLLANVPPDCTQLAAGSCSAGVVPHGKRQPPGPPGSVQGRNHYSDWFAGDPDMAGDYLGYDGPCPPWNDSRVHHYHFELHALDVARLALEAGFTLDDLRRAMAGHVLASAAWVGTYTLNPALAGTGG